MNFLQVWACLKKKDPVKILPLRHTHPHSRWNYSLLPEVTGSRGFVVFLHQDVSQDKNRHEDNSSSILLLTVSYFTPLSRITKKKKNLFQTPFL